MMLFALTSLCSLNDQTYYGLQNVHRQSQAQVLQDITQFNMEGQPLQLHIYKS